MSANNMATIMPSLDPKGTSLVCWQSYYQSRYIVEKDRVGTPYGVHQQHSITLIFAEPMKARQRALNNKGLIVCFYIIS